MEQQAPLSEGYLPKHVWPLGGIVCVWEGGEGLTYCEGFVLQFLSMCRGFAI